MTDVANADRGDYDDAIVAGMLARKVAHRANNVLITLRRKALDVACGFR